MGVPHRTRYLWERVQSEPQPSREYVLHFHIVIEYEFGRRTTPSAVSIALGDEEKKRSCWVHEVNQNKQESGEYIRLSIELESYEDRFLKYSFMSRECFEELHDLVKWKIRKCTTKWRKPIGTRQRLAICLR
ncbi:hypothetical protein HHI36_014715 [Cryptolaemus montrouzieri]|uniref:Uncharacterized protein n=1 Tax=Cryptolaemus montrouzieri TaxID=559131 RepID=A0ABD2N3E5_9CUCU